MNRISTTGAGRRLQHICVLIFVDRQNAPRTVEDRLMLVLPRSDPQDPKGRGEMVDERRFIETLVARAA